MDFQRGGLDFWEADRRYAEIRRQRDAGTLSDEEFDAQRKHLMVQDEEGLWWARGRDADEWFYRGEEGWVRGTPPAYQPVAPQPEPRSEPLRSKQEPTRPLPQTVPPGPPQPPNSPVREQARQEQRRGVPAWVWVVVPLAALALIGLAVVAVFVLANRPSQVPDLIGQTKSAAERSAEGEGFGISFSSKAGDEPKDTIVSQDPEPDERAEQGSTIDVTVSAGEGPEQASSSAPDDDSSSSPVSAGSTGSATPPGGSEEELRAAVDDYYAAVDREDWSDTYDALDSQTQERFTREEWTRKNEFYADNYPLTQSSTEIAGDAGSPPVLVNLTQTFANGDVRSRSTYFVVEDGSWKHRLSPEELDLFMAEASFEEFAKAKAP